MLSVNEHNLYFMVFPFVFFSVHLFQPSFFLFGQLPMMVDMNMNNFSSCLRSNLYYMVFVALFINYVVGLGKSTSAQHNYS